MKKALLILLSAIMLLSAVSCQKQDKDQEISVEPLNDEYDFKLHNDSNYYCMTLGGYFNDSTIVNESQVKKSVHNLLMKNDDESQADKEYYMEEYEYTYTIVSISNIGYDTFGLDEDNYTVTSVSTYNTSYFTDRNIRVGDTRKMVKDAYGSADKKETSDDGYVTWIYQSGEYSLEFSFQGKTLVQIMLSRLPDNIYEVTTGSSSSGNIITIDENGNIIGGSSDYEITVESTVPSTSSSDLSSSQEASSKSDDSSSSVSSAPSSSTENDTSSSVDTNSGTIIDIGDNGEISNVIIEGN